VRRVGENMPRKVDTRVVAATNRSLEDEVRAGLHDKKVMKVSGAKRSGELKAADSHRQIVETDLFG